jgi:hypothetical protein
MMKKIINVVIMLSVSLLFTACTGTNLPANAGTSSFKAGSNDGCTTASGSYTKNSNAFRNDKDYKDGWFYGRKKCNPAQSK